MRVLRYQATLFFHVGAKRRSVAASIRGASQDGWPFGSDSPRQLRKTRPRRDGKGSCLMPRGPMKYPRTPDALRDQGVTRKEYVAFLDLLAEYQRKSLLPAGKSRLSPPSSRKVPGEFSFSQTTKSKGQHSGDRQERYGRTH